MGEKWEYKRETSEFHLTEQDFIDWLNEEGQKGWELVEYKMYDEDLWGRNAYTCIFKRKI